MKKSTIIILILCIIIIQNLILGILIINTNTIKIENEPLLIVQEPIILTKKFEPIYMTATAYTNRPEETNECELTATMENAIPGWTVAVSRDKLHWLGGRVYIEGIGVRRVNDLMNKRFINTIDLCVGNVSEARTFGKKELQVTFLGH